MGCGVEGISGLSGSVVFSGYPPLGCRAVRRNVRADRGAGQPRARGPKRGREARFPATSTSPVARAHKRGTVGGARHGGCPGRAHSCSNHAYRAASRPYGTGVRPTCTPHRPGVRIWHTKARARGGKPPLGRQTARRGRAGAERAGCATLAGSRQQLWRERRAGAERWPGPVRYPRDRHTKGDERGAANPGSPPSCVQEEARWNGACTLDDGVESVVLDRATDFDVRDEGYALVDAVRPRRCCPPSSMLSALV